MSKFLVAITAVITLTSAALAQTQPFNTHTYMQSFNQADKTFAGYRSVTGNPCPDSSYSDSVPFSGVKTPEEAVKQTKSRVDEITDRIQKEYDRCHPH